MKKIIIVCGLIGGFVVTLPMLISVDACYAGGDLNRAMLIGYASMILAFSLVFVGIRNYRNKYNHGVISFGKAFKTGMLIVLVTSTIYVIAWMISYYNFYPDFAERYGTIMVNKLKASGGSQAEVDAMVRKMDSFSKMYKNPLNVALFTYIEILPVGLIVSLISALILKKKPSAVPV